MSNTITAFFKGRVGVAEAVYQNDYGIVMNLDGLDLPAHFDCYFSVMGEDEAIPGIGADRQVVIPNSCLSKSGTVTLHIPIHSGTNDSEVEYIVYFKVIGRARPVDDGTPAQMTAIEQALALLQNPIGNIEQIVNEALAFTGDTFDEMKQELQDDFDNYTETLEGDLATWKGGVESDIDDVEHDFTVLQNQFDTAVAAVTTDTEVTDIRVGADGVTDTTAGASVRRQFTNLKNGIDYIGDIVGIEETLVSSNSDFVNVNQCYKSDGSFEGYSGWNTTDYIDCHSWDSISFDLAGFNEPSMDITLATIAFFDENKSFISAIAMDATGSATFSGTGNIPATAYYFKALGNSSIQTNPRVSLKKGGTIIEDIATLQTQYTDVSNSMDDLQETVEKESACFNSLEKSDEKHVGVSSFSQYTVPKYFDTDGNEYDGGTGWKTTQLLPCFGFRAMSFHVWRFYGGIKMASIAFFDADKEFISGVWANYLPDGQGEFVGQCAIPDNAYYYCAVTNTGEQSYTPNVTLYKESVAVDLTGLLQTSNVVYTRTGGVESYSGWYRSQYIPVKGFKSLSFVAGGFHAGDIQLESVTFFDINGERVDGVFANYPDNNPRNGRGTAPIPPTADYATLLYNSSESEQPSLTLHNPAHTLMNILCIGDSITEGQTAGMVTLLDNYPKNMQDNLGYDYTVTNAGVGGSQAITWWSTWRHLLNLKSYNTDVIIIMLGANGGFEPTFDTDVDPYDDYNDYANTITGKTCALIEWLQEQLPNAEIVMATPTYINSALAPGNASASYAQCMYMSSLVDRYHLAVIDVRNLMGISHHNSGHWLASDGVHGTPLFYQKLGMLFANQIKPIINIPNK